MGFSNWKVQTFGVGVFAIFSSLYLVWGFTDPRDVYAIVQLHNSLGSPQLPGWSPGGDPCGPPSWQGVECVNANITAIKLNDANLSGVLTEDLGSFASIIIIDLSKNRIGGSIPPNLPITLRNFFLSDNQFTGQMPDTLSQLSQLTDLSLNNNQLNGSIPDAFQPLMGLLHMDLSGNNLTGMLPSSMGNLSSLTTLHLQNNQLTGVLDILQDLSITDLDIENNMFSGPIPGKLLSIPNFRRAGNPFNTTVLPSPPALPPTFSPSEAPSPQPASRVRPHGSSVATSPFPQSETTEKKNTSKRFLWIAIAVLVVLVLFLGLCLSVYRCCRSRTGLSRKSDKRNEMAAFDVLSETHKQHFSSQNRVEKASKNADTLIDIRGSNSTDLPSGSLPFPLLPAERIKPDPNLNPRNARGNASKTVQAPAKPFTIASLQQYTNSFSKENLIGKGSLGTVYRAQLPNGKVLAVKMLDKSTSGHVSDQIFLDMVSRIFRFQHENIVELVGYCLEHGHCLLVYNYCRNRTLDEALNSNDEINKNLSWNVRMHLALQAAKVLEYLHEECNPQTVHGNFKSCNLLLDDDLAARISDCGLAPLMSPDSMSQLQRSGYGAPELETGTYSYHSDVYSFGVIMLQLLTGRKSYDRLRPRGEQYLVPWAFSCLHDIDALSRMVDPSLNGDYPSMSLSRVADIISLCIQPEPEFRPPMSEIVQKLVHLIQRGS